MSAASGFSPTALKRRPKLVLKRTKAADYADQDYLAFSSQILPGNLLPSFYHRYFTMNQTYENSIYAEYNVDQHQFQVNHGFSIFMLKAAYLTKTTDRILSTGTQTKTEYEIVRLVNESVLKIIDPSTCTHPVKKSSR